MSTEQMDPRTVEEVEESVRAVNGILRRRGWSFTQQRTPEQVRAWGRAMAGSRQWDSAEALAAYLIGEAHYWTGHLPTADERVEITKTATRIWTNAASERVAPTIPPGGIRFAVCAFSPCRRQYEQAKGFGVFCAKQCMIDEANTPGTFAPTVPLVDEDDAAGVS